MAAPKLPLLRRLAALHRGAPTTASWDDLLVDAMTRLLRGRQGSRLRPGLYVAGLDEPARDARAAVAAICTRIVARLPEVDPRLRDPQLSSRSRGQELHLVVRVLTPDGGTACCVAVLRPDLAAEIQASP